MGFGLRIGACEVPSKLACRLCDALLFPSLPLFPSLLLLPLLFLAAVVSCCWFPHCCVRRPVSLGPLSGFARRLQSPVETGSRHTDAARVHVFLKSPWCRPALAKYRRSWQPTRRRSEGHGEPVRKYLISQFGPFLSYTEGRFCPAMLIFGQAGVELDWVGLAWVVLDWDGLGLGLNWTGDGTGTGLNWTGDGPVWGLRRDGAEEGAERKEEDGLESKTLGHPPMVLRTADY